MARRMSRVCSRGPLAGAREVDVVVEGDADHDRGEEHHGEHLDQREAGPACARRHRDGLRAALSRAARQGLRRLAVSKAKVTRSAERSKMPSTQTTRTSTRCTRLGASAPPAPKALGAPGAVSASSPASSAGSSKGVTSTLTRNLLVLDLGALELQASPRPRAGSRSRRASRRPAARPRCGACCPLAAHPLRRHLREDGEEDPEDRHGGHHLEQRQRPLSSSHR